MMGKRQADQPAFFYDFSLEEHVPANHLLRSIDRFIDLEGVRTHRRAGMLDSDQGAAER